MVGKDLKKVERVVLVSAIVLLAIGAVLIYLGYLTNSIGLIADGIDSIGDAGISLIVWFGLLISKRAPDHRFHFGYYKIETLSALIVAFLMIGMSIIIFQSAYQRLIHPEELESSPIAIAALIGAGTISASLAFVKNKMASKYNLLSLRADAKNSIKDSSASFVILAGVLLAHFGFLWGDPVGAMIVAFYIIFVAITTIKEASLVPVSYTHLTLPTTPYV